MLELLESFSSLLISFSIVFGIRLGSLGLSYFLSALIMALMSDYQHDAFSISSLIFFACCLRASSSRCSLANSRALTIRSFYFSFFSSASLLAVCYYCLSFLFTILAVLAWNSYIFFFFSASFIYVFYYSIAASTSACYKPLMSETSDL